MSEEIKEQKTEWQLPDAFLQFLVDIANQNQSQLFLPITLYVKGLIVTGLLISGKTYHDEFAAQMRQALQTSVAEEGLAEFEEDLKSFGEHYEPPNDPDGTDPLNVRYIHLRGVKIYQAGAAAPIPSEGGILWRGRLDCVDGFSFGMLLNVPRS